MKKTLKLSVLFFLCQFLFLMSAPLYKIHDLGTLRSAFSSAYSINQNGEITGVFKNNNEYEVFLWTEANGLLGTHHNSDYPPKINIHGQIAFTHKVSGWFWSSYHVAIWDKHNGYQDLGIPEGSKWKHAFVVSINDAGHILVKNGIQPENKDYPLTALAIWKDGHFEEITCKNFSLLIGMDNQGLVLMNSDYKTTGKASPLLYDIYDNKTTEIPLKNHAFGLNVSNRGQVVGLLYNNRTWDGFFWDAKMGVKILKDLIPKFCNSKGIVIGEDQEKDIYVYSLISAEKWHIEDLISKDEFNPFQTILEVFDINEKGQIIGMGLFNGEGHAFILDPIK